MQPGQGHGNGCCTEGGCDWSLEAPVVGVTILEALRFVPRPFAMSCSLWMASTGSINWRLVVPTARADARLACAALSTCKVFDTVLRVARTASAIFQYY